MTYAAHALDARGMLKHGAGRRVRGVAFAGPDGVGPRTSWSELDRMGGDAAAFLLDAGAGPERPIAVVADTGLDVLVTLRGSLHAGAPFTVLPPPTSYRAHVPRA